jgi:hypothetical protein
MSATEATGDYYTSVTGETEINIRKFEPRNIKD